MPSPLSSHKHEALPIALGVSDCSVSNQVHSLLRVGDIVMVQWRAGTVQGEGPTLFVYGSTVASYHVPRVSLFRCATQVGLSPINECLTCTYRWASHMQVMGSYKSKSPYIQRISAHAARSSRRMVLGQDPTLLDSNLTSMLVDGTHAGSRNVSAVVIKTKENRVERETSLSNSQHSLSLHPAIFCRHCVT